MRGRRSGRLRAHSRRPGGRNEKTLKRVCGQEGKRNAERPAPAKDAAHGRPRAGNGTIKPVLSNRRTIRPRRSGGSGRMPSDPRRQRRRFMTASEREANNIRHAGGRTEGPQKTYGLICRRQKRVTAKSCTAVMRADKKVHTITCFFYAFLPCLASGRGDSTVECDVKRFSLEIVSEAILPADFRTDPRVSSARPLERMHLSMLIRSVRCSLTAHPWLFPGPWPFSRPR